MELKQLLQLQQASMVLAIAFGGLLLILLTRKGVRYQKRKQQEPCLPGIPGALPLIGNLLQLTDKKPHKTFTRWAEVYGPIYSAQMGASTVVVLNSTDVVKEAMVTRYSSISTRKLSNALKILTSDKCMVATSDYNDFHKTVKRHIITGLLGSNAQKQFRSHRDQLIETMLLQLHACVEDNPLEAVNLRNIVEPQLFGLALKQALGKDLEMPIYVEELGTTLSRHEIFQVLVVDPMMGAIDVDWRDFFPYLRWVPNRRPEMKIHHMYKRRRAVMQELIGEQKKRIASGQKLNSYLDFLLSEAQTLNEEEVNMLIWETIIETSDTTLITTEWAMYELSKNANYQDRLYREIQNVCGSEKLTEGHLSQLPFLNAVFHETLRKYSPVPVIPLRYAHEDTTLGGYHIPAGTEIAINIYGCNMDKKQWGDPELWRPERFLDSKYDQVDLYKTMAFGGGKRVCTGAQQAITIASVSIGTFVKEFKWTLNKGQEEDVDTVGLTSHKLHPLKTIITKRSIGKCCYS